MIDLKLSLVGEKIKVARIEKRFTLEQLSERIGISRNFLWEIEAGRKAPSIQTLYNIGKELKISIDYILGLSNDIKWIDNKDEQKLNLFTNKLDEKERIMLNKLLEAYFENK